MELILFICSEETCQYHRVSSRVPATKRIVLSGQPFILQEPVELLVREEESYWYFEDGQGQNFQIYNRGRPFRGQSIPDQSVLQIKTVHREQLCILAFTDIHVCRTFKLYSLVYQTNIPLGKQNGNFIQYDISGLVSNLHARLLYVNQNWTISAIGRNGIFLNGERIRDCRRLQYGDMVDVFGLRILYLGEEIAVQSHGCTPVIYESLKPVGEQAVDTTDSVPYRVHEIYHRSPRAVLLHDQEEIDLDAPPSMREPYRRPVLLTIGPALTMAIPMVLGFAVASYGMKMNGQTGGAYMYTGLITAVTSAMLGTLWASLNVKSEQKRYEEAERQRKAAYTSYMMREEEKIRKQYEEQGNALHSMYPSAREVCRYDEHTHVLWNRNVMHEDFLKHRIGLGDALFQTKINIPKEKFEVYEDALKYMPGQLMAKYRMLHNVPFCVDFDRHRLVGVIEDRNESPMLRMLIVQFAVQHAYTDVKLVCFLDGRCHDEEDDRGFIRWLPHVWSEDRRTRFVDFGEGHSEELIYELSQILRRRLEMHQLGEGQPDLLPHYIIMVENYKRLEDALPIQYLLSMQKECGITTILFAHGYEELPNECSYILQKNKHFTGVYDLEGGDARRNPVCMDYVGWQEAEQLTRRLSGIETVEPKMGAKLPDALTLYELLGVGSPDKLEIEKNWKESRPDLYLKAAIGVKSTGGICYLDVHEKAHGPHGLVAGMTGSGKSELLQTYIIAMAVRYRPEEVGFFLIDYKGGGMANLFLKLPHLIGHISNLSGTMVHRAMVSIKSENQRRQELFNRSHVNHIHDYIRLYRAGRVEEPLPHILIIIDEFAELKKEEPDFMKELISVAQVGRSLGVHLILATQKPAGTVDDNIRSNARFRLCLRVQDRQDSTDMLHKADAAYITQAGRAYFQVGNDELYELFQGGFSGARYEQERSSYQKAAVLLELSGREEYYGQHQKDSHQETDEGSHSRTQLEVTIEKLVEVQARIGGRKVRRLWLPMLPEQLFLSDLSGQAAGAMTDEHNREICVAIGMYDCPGKQLQDTFYLRLTEGGHHMICGTVTSGKSTFLQTLLFALIAQYAPDQINLYIIDCSSHFLSPFQRVPHTGGLMGEHELGEMKKTIHLLHQVLEERKQLLRGGNFRQYIKTVALLPAMVLVIDNYASFKERTEGCFESDLMEFSRIGEGYGIYLVITAAGTGAGEVTVRMAENFRTVICLQMTDKYQYAGILRVPRVEMIPESGIPGRGLARVNGELLEFQTALAADEPDDYVRLKQLDRLCDELCARWSNHSKARRVPQIPEPFTAKGFLHEVLPGTSGDILPVGYFTETAELCAYNYENLFCLTVSGRRNTGRRSLLKLMLEEERSRNSAVYIIDTKEGYFKDYREGEGDHVAGYYSKAEETYGFYEKLGETFRKRNERKTILKKAGKSQNEIYSAMCENQRLFIVITDLGDWIGQHYTDPILQQAEPLMFNLLEKGELHNIFFTAAFRQESYAEVTGRRLFDAYTGYGTGIRMGGHTGEERILDFSYVTYSEQDRQLKPGHGMVPQMEVPACHARGQVVVPDLYQES